MSGKKAEGRSGGVMGWISTACRFASDRNDFRSGRLGRKKPFRLRLDVSSAGHVVYKQRQKRLIQVVLKWKKRDIFYSGSC